MARFCLLGDPQKIALKPKVGSCPLQLKSQTHGKIDDSVQFISTFMALLISHTKFTNQHQVPANKY